MKSSFWGNCKCEIFRGNKLVFTAWFPHTWPMLRSLIRTPCSTDVLFLNFPCFLVSLYFPGILRVLTFFLVFGGTEKRNGALVRREEGEWN